MSVLYETHWKGFLRPSCQREADLSHARQHILEYWAGAPLQLRQANWVYRRMRVGAAQRELARAKGARFLPPGYSYVNHQTWARQFRGTFLVCRRVPLVQGSRSSLVARENFRILSNS